MKTLMSCLVLALLILASSFTSANLEQFNEQSSVNSSFKSFRAHRQGKAGVALSWSISAPNVVQFVVERSYDGEFFEPVTGMGCNGAGVYKYADNDIFPGVIHYRITAIKGDGSTESSPVESVRIVQRG